MVSHNVCATEAVFEMWQSVLQKFFLCKVEHNFYMLRPLAHLNLNFVHGDGYRSIFIFLHVGV